MKFKIKSVFFTSVFLFVVSFIAYYYGKHSPSEWNRAAWGTHGFIENGTVFGVTVGDTTESAKNHLTGKGLRVVEITRLIGTQNGKVKSCHYREYPVDITLYSFSDSSWRRGTMCIATQNDKVVSIDWVYGMYQP